MPVTQPSAEYNAITNTIYPKSTSTWGGLSGTTWESWTNWAYSTEDTIIWHTPYIDFGATITSFTLDIETESTGIVSYEVYTSMSGEIADFVGVSIAPGSSGVASFTGRLCLVVVKSERILDMPVITSIQVNPVVSDPIIVNFSQVDSASLPGTITNRILPLNRLVSKVTDVKIMPNEVTAYNLDLYVSNTPTSTYVIPKVISRSTTNINFALVGVDNHPRDAVVDIVVQCLPEQYMDGNNLKIR